HTTSTSHLYTLSLHDARPIYFAGHFPNRPVMPGVLILEAMAQAGAVLAYKSTNTTPEDGVLYYFAGIDNVRFRKIVEPGDQLRLDRKSTRLNSSHVKISYAVF